jgi:hypothetical protein
VLTRPSRCLLFFALAALLLLGCLPALASASPSARPAASPTGSAAAYIPPPSSDPTEERNIECVINGLDNPVKLRVTLGSHIRGKHALTFFVSNTGTFPNTGPTPGRPQCPAGPNDGQTATLQVNIQAKDRHGKWRWFRATRVLTLVKNSWQGFPERAVKDPVLPKGFQYIMGHHVVHIDVQEKVSARAGDQHASESYDLGNIGFDDALDPVT